MLSAVSELCTALFFRPTVPTPPVPSGWTVKVSDRPGAIGLDDADASAAQMLREMAFAPRTFTARVDADDPVADATVRFPSPAADDGTGAGGCPGSGEVALDWFHARDKLGQLAEAPAVLVLDILQGGNVISAFIAKVLSRSGIHAFAMHVPQNGKRSDGGRAFDWSYFLPGISQATQDARRARDVIAALPGVTGTVGVQGTSLGGFIAASAAAIDRAFNPVLITLAGGDVFSVLKDGRVDAARVYRNLREVGHDDATLRRVLWKTEPMRIAHRLDPTCTWLATARRDQVVPARNSRWLADAARLPAEHRLQFSGCHYSCVMSAPWMLQWTIQRIKATHAGLAMPTAGQLAIA